MERSAARRGAVGVVAAAVLVSVAVYPRLPEQMVTHWDATGEPNGWTGRFRGAFFLPALAAVLLPSMWYLPRIDPRHEAYDAFRPAYEWFVVGTLAFLLYVHALVLAVNLGVDIPLSRGLAPAVSALYYGVGRLIQRTERNRFAGVRTPWTLDDEETWAATNARSARGFKLAAVVALGGAVWPRWTVAFVVAPVLLVTADALVYSYRHHRRAEE